MDIYIDTADINEIKKASEWGIIDGVTTNPSILSKEKGDVQEKLGQICEIVDGPVSAEVISTEAEGMVEEAQELVDIHENIVVKVPVILEGLKAINKLTSMGIETNTTLIFTPMQALMAAKAGASYVSPFVGRLDDIQSPGLDMVEKVTSFFENYDIETKTIIASIRNPIHLLEVSRLGADICTLPYKTIKEIAKHPKTDMGLKKFLEDWKNVEQKEEELVLEEIV